MAGAVRIAAAGISFKYTTFDLEAPWVMTGRTISSLCAPAVIRSGTLVYQHHSLVNRFAKRAESVETPSQPVVSRRA